MRRRQTAPRQWLIIASATDLARATRAPAETGVLVLGSLSPADMRCLRRAGVTVVREGRRGAARVHNVRELRRAMLPQTPLVLLSPMHPTQTHPDWKPIPRMRAAALARLARRRLIALGGMDARKFARIKTMGFQGWAGMSAFRT